jgi:WD40 repeat protein
MTIREFDRSWAILVAVDQYENGIPALSTPVADATELADVLQHLHGYEPTLITNKEATQAAITTLLAGLASRVGPNDRVFFYFAGHGIALPSDSGPRGFILPQDAKKVGSPEDTYIPMTDLDDLLSSLPCRHGLVVLDCCFAGALRWSSYRYLPPAPAKLHRERYRWFIEGKAWQAIASAAHNQEAIDVAGSQPLGKRDNEDAHSPFARALISGLRGKADRASIGGTGDGVITATELYQHIDEALQTSGGRWVRQTPILWPMKKHETGEFVFLVPGFSPEQLEPAPPLDLAANPWRGLKPYDTTDANLFFGRQRVTDLLAEKAAEQRFIVVTGPSGIGKSSLVRAGLLPRLPSGTQTILLRPGPSPFTSLATALRALNPGSEIDENRLSTNARALVECLEALPPNRQTLLVVDQAEELITMGGAESTEHFLELLECALKDSPERISVLLTIRTEFEPQFAQSALKQRWAAARFIVPQMTQDELHRVIEGPAAAKTMRFESPALVDQLVNEVVQMPGALPLLSFALSEMYNHYLARQTDDRTLTEADYAILEGGVTGSLRVRANQLADGLDAPSQVSLRRVMERMVSVESGEYARRRVPRQELNVADPAEQARIVQVITELDNARLIVTDSGTNISYLELAHDALIFGWDRLVNWLRQDAPLIVDLRALTKDATEWDPDRKQKAELLWTDPARLSEIKRLQTEPYPGLNRVEHEFALASINRASWNKKFRWAVSTVLFVALLGVGIALKIADQRQTLAELQQRLAQAASFTRTAFSEVNKDPEVAALYAVHAVRLSGEDQEQSGFAEQILRLALSNIRAIPLRGQSRYGDGADQRSSNAVGSISHSQSEKMLAFATYGGRLYVRQLGYEASSVPLKIVSSEPNEWKKFFSTRFARITSVAFAFGDRWLILQESSAKDNNKIRILDSHASFEEVAAPPEWQIANKLSVSPNGETVAILSNFGQTLTLWFGNAQTPPTKGPSIHPYTSVEKLSFTADGKNLLLQHDLFNFTIVASDGSKTRTINLPPELPFLKEEFGFRGANPEDYLARISPDARYLLSSAKVFSDRSQPQRLGAIWDISKKPARQLRTFPNRKNALADADFSADGRWLAVGHDTKTMLWDLAKVNPQAEPSSVIISKEFGSVTFDRESKKIAIADLSGNGTVADLTRPETIDQPVVVAGLGANSLGFSGSGIWLAAGDDDGTVRICDVSRDCRAVEGGSTQPRKQDIAGCSGLSGIWTVSLMSGGGIGVWLDRDRTLPRSFTLLPSTNGSDTTPIKLRAICSADKHRMFVYSDSSADRFLFDLSAANPASSVLSIPNYPAKIDSAQFDSTSTWLVAGSKETMSAANLSDPSHIQFKPLAGYKGGEIEFSPSSHWLLEKVPFTYPRDSKLVPLLRKVRATEIGDPIRLAVSKAPLANFAFSADDAQLFASEELELATRGDYEAVGPAVKSYLWDMQAIEGAPPRILDGHRQVAGAVFSSDGHWIATVDAKFLQRQKIIRLWHVEKTVRQVMGFELEAPGQILYPAFDPKNRWFILGKGITAAFYDLAKIAEKDKLDPDPTFELPSGTSITAHWQLQFSPDARWLINQGRSEPLRIWSWSKDDDVQLVSDVPEQQGETKAFFLGDKAVTSTQSTVIWTLNNASRTAKRVSLPGSGEILIHPDQQRITVLSNNGERTWTLNTAALTALAERLISRNLTLSEWSRVLPGKLYEKAFSGLPEDATVIRGYVESAQASAQKGNQKAANAFYKLAVNSARDARNPILALRVAESGLSNDATEAIAEAAELTVKFGSNDPRALRARGLVRVSRGDQSGVSDIQKYIGWASEHGASSDDLREESDAIRSFQSKQRN